MGHCTFCIPYAVVTIKGRISGDGYELEEASMDLGANRIQTFLRVTLPSMVPGIMSAAFLSFTLSIDDVVMSNMLSGARNSTLPDVYKRQACIRSTLPCAWIRPSFTSNCSAPIFRSQGSGVRRICCPPYTPS